MISFLINLPSIFEHLLENILKRLAAAAYVVNGRVEQDFALTYHQRVVEYALDIVDKMGRDEHSRILRVILHDYVEYAVARSGVDTAERLIENIELRVAAHDENELELLLHAL